MVGGRASGGLLTVLLVLATVTTALPGPAAASGHTAPPPPEQTFSVSEQVHAWERGGLSLRASSASAVIEVDNADWRVRNGSEKESNLNRDPMAIYSPGTSVTFEFNASLTNTNTSSFERTDVQVIAAHVDEDSDAAVPDSFGDALDLVSEDTANENASYEELSAQTLGSSGNVTFEYTPEGAGIHTVFVAVNGTGPGFDTSGDSLSVGSNVTVIGAERILVTKSTGSVNSEKDVERGTSAEFDVDASRLNSSSVTHSLVVYDSSTYRSSSFVVNLTSPITSDFDAETDSELLTSLDGVNGEADIQDSTPVLGADPDDSYVLRSAGPASLMDLVSEQAGGNANLGELRESDGVLNASVTVREADPTLNLSVETSGQDGNWSTAPDNYRWVYIGIGANSREMIAKTGTLNVTVLPPGPDEDEGNNGSDDDEQEDETGGDGDAGAPASGGGGGSSPSGGGGGAPGDGTGPIAPPTSDTGDDEPDSGIQTNLLGDATVLEIASVNASEPVTVSLDQAIDTVAREELFTIEQQTLSFTSSTESGTIRVADAGREPAEVPPLDRPRDVGYVEMTEQVSDSEIAEASVTFSLPEERRRRTGVPPEEVTMYRYHNDSWSALDTDHLGGERYQATVPGFSVFSVGAPVGIEATRLDATAVEPGDSVVVTAQVTNVEESATSLALQLTAEDQQLIRRSVDLAAGETRNVTLTTFVDEPGTYQLSLNGRDVDELTVEAAETAEQTAVDTAGGDSQETPPTGGEGTAASGDGESGDGAAGSSGVTNAPTLASIAVALVVVLITVVLARRWFDL